MLQDLMLQHAVYRPQDAPHSVPTYKHKADAYMLSAINAPISPIGQIPSYKYGSVLDAKLRKDDNPSLFKRPGTTIQANAEDQTTYFDDHKTHRRNMRLSLFHLLMSRCQTLQCILNASECKSQSQRPNPEIHSSYSSIYRFAREAKRIAEGLQSDALQARSEYWAGRGCSGLQDWQTATMHFTNAIRLDMSHAISKQTNSRYRGLLPYEKEDVEFLLQNAAQRHRDKVSTDQNKPGIKGLRSKGLKGPPWTPNRDFKNYVATQRLEKNKRAGQRKNVFLTKEGRIARKLRKEEIPMIRKRLAMLDDNALFRRLFNADDWFYILRGDPTLNECTSSAKDNGNGEADGSRDDTAFVTRLPPSPVIDISKPSSPERLYYLDDELQEPEYTNDEQSPLLPSTSSFIYLAQPNDGNVPHSPASACLQDRRTTQTMLVHADSTKQEVGVSSPILTPASEAGSTSMMDYAIKEGSVDKMDGPDM